VPPARLAIRDFADSKKGSAIGTGPRNTNRKTYLRVGITHLANSKHHPAVESQRLTSGECRAHQTDGRQHLPHGYADCSFQQTKMQPMTSSNILNTWQGSLKQAADMCISPAAERRMETTKAYKNGRKEGNTTHQLDEFTQLVPSEARTCQVTDTMKVPNALRTWLGGTQTGA